MNFPDEIKMIKFEYQGQPHEIPLDAFSAAMDKICYLAFWASNDRIPFVFNWLNSEIHIPITNIEFPYTNDPEAVCAHLLYNRIYWHSKNFSPMEAVPLHKKKFRKFWKST